jgi:hypothetical protein
MGVISKGLWLVLSAATATLGCDVCSDDEGVWEDEKTSCSDESLEEERPHGGAAPAREPQSMIIITDHSRVVSVPGRAGVDISEVTVTCADGPVAATVESYDLGDSRPCDGMNASSCVCMGDGYKGAPCAVGPSSGQATRAVNGFTVEQDERDYVSLGHSGHLVLAYADSIAGCALEIIEVENPSREVYSVRFCVTADWTTCSDADRVVSDASGSVEAVLP